MRMRWASRTQRVDCSGCDSWPLTASCPARIPASLLVTCAGKTSPAGHQNHRGIGIHRGVAQALLTEIGDDIGIVVDQRQHGVAAVA
jgi:hypothetical protein